MQVLDYSVCEEVIALFTRQSFDPIDSVIQFDPILHFAWNIVK
jgi:hypothetical protein